MAQPPTSINHPEFVGTGQFVQMSMALALELVSGLSQPSEVFSRHGYSAADAAKMLNNPQFKQMLREAKSAWNADMNAEERIRLKARLALEEMLPAHYDLATNPDTPAAARNEAVKTFERLSGMAAKEQAGAAGGGDRFVVNINLGENKSVTIDAPAQLEPAA